MIQSIDALCRVSGCEGLSGKRRESVLIRMQQQCQSSGVFTTVIFPLSENVVNFDKSLQLHEYYWPLVACMAALPILY